VDVQIIALEEAFAQTPLGEICKLFESSPEIAAGVFIFQPGKRVPQEGFSAHDGTEISIVLSGEMLLGFEHDRKQTVKEGDVVIIPKGVPHYSQNVSEREAKIFWTIAPASGL
jgi:quercetin dioxygenase-like cupin family protein